MTHLNILLAIAILAPFLGSLASGLLGKFLKVTGTNLVTIPLMALSLAASSLVFYLFWKDDPISPYIVNFYEFGPLANLHFMIGFMIDRLTAFMMIVVTFVSFLVHVYSVGYMKGDPGYARFFSYISGFTFAMLSLVMANNFLLLFFGWEGVGLFSYLLIGFWFHRESANYASLKAFIANRVGDFGFLLGIAVILSFFGTIDYQTTFAMAPSMTTATISLFGQPVNVITLAAILLFLGAAGKSAQIPLHIWLEGSMEGPTPISALIHAATMVTAGVFMLARLSPLFEYSNTALSVVMVLGALTCLLMGLIGIVQNDIKRVIAYSTLSQLGYMMAAQGASAYPVGMFHLMTHACFKALLFLAAGSVIVALHHEQDMRKMGGLAKKMPVTYICMLIGALALCGIPPFAGFFSKDLIIDAVANANVPGHHFAWILIVAATLVTALYTFRMFFLVFHGKPRMSEAEFQHVQESPWTITLPLIILAIPSVLMGFFFFHDDLNGFFGSSIYIAPNHPAVAILTQAYQSSGDFLAHGVLDLPCLLGILGIILSYLAYARFPKIPEFIAKRFAWIQTLLIKKYFVDDVYDYLSTGTARLFGMICYRVGDIFVIDRTVVEGSARSFMFLGTIFRRLQTGRLYHYALGMVLGLFVLLSLVWFGM